jgi:hypothetical protein
MEIGNTEINSLSEFTKHSLNLHDNQIILARRHNKKLLLEQYRLRNQSFQYQSD